MNAPLYVRTAERRGGRSVSVYVYDVIDKRTSVILRRYVVGQIVVQNQPQQSVEQRQIDLLIDLRQDSLHQDITFAFTGLPDVSQVVDPLAPLVNQEWRWLGILRTTLIYMRRDRCNKHSQLV